MKTRNEILALAVPLPTEPGIYFLVSNGEIVYVGQSVTPVRRLGDHSRDKVFDSVAFVPHPKGPKLNYLEHSYIRKFKPKYNGTTDGRIPDRKRDISFDRLLEAAQAVKPVSEAQYSALRQRQGKAGGPEGRTE